MHNIKRLNEKRQDGGFTLVELLVVIVILGILSAVVVFAVGGITNKGQDSACKSEKRSVETAEEAFFANQSTSLYAAENDLAPGFLRSQSTNYNVTLQGTISTSGDGSGTNDRGTAYKLVFQGDKCGPDGTDA